MGESFSIPISRRDFFKMAGLTAGAFLVGSTENPKKVEAATVEQNFKFDVTNIPTLMRADVCVCGGGPSGTAAAINAAKNGAKVILIERGIALGGLQTLGCVFPVMPTKISGTDTPYILELNENFRKHGENPLIYREAKKILNESGGLANYIPELLSEIYDEMCEQYGVEILYNTSIIGAVTENQKIFSCIINTLEGISKIDAKIFIDATGDAVLSRRAGVPVEKGSEKTGRNQPMSFRFEMGGININKVYNFFTKKYNDDWSKTKPPVFEFVRWKKTEEFFKKGVASGELTQDDILYIQAFTIPGKPNTMSMNCPEMPPLEFSATDAISYSKAVTFGRKMMRRLAKFFIKNLPGFEKAYISREASILGVRESWRVHGKYYMTDADYWSRKKFPDAVCMTAYPIDIHDTNLTLEKLRKGEFYEIPYRALVTNEIENLIVAGRCASGSFAAQASFRIQPTCMSMGEAAGIAAAYGLKNNIAVNQIDWAQIPNRSYTSKG